MLTRGFTYHLSSFIAPRKANKTSLDLLEIIKWMPSSIALSLITSNNKSLKGGSNVDLLRICLQERVNGGYNHLLN
jgi:hypothetical protein